MRIRTAIIFSIVVIAGTLTGVVFAQFADSRTASGSVNVTSDSPDLYICEPDLTSGPACGSDDSDADEIIFEETENIKPGAIIVQDIRLKNVGSSTWTVSGVNMEVIETSDPGGACPSNALLHLPVPGEDNNPEAQIGIQILGKSNDPLNDNTRTDLFPVFLHRLVPSEEERNIRILPGDYEDLRLGLQMIGTGAENCDGNEWEVSYRFTVIPTN